MPVSVLRQSGNILSCKQSAETQTAPCFTLQALECWEKIAAYEMAVVYECALSVRVYISVYECFEVCACTCMWYVHVCNGRRQSSLLSPAF